MLLSPYYTTSSVGAGSAYFFEERFEGTGYTNTWDETAGTGTMDEDYTGVVLEGSQSLRLLAATQHPRVIAILPSDQTELWLFFQMQIVTTLSTTRTVVALMSGTPAQSVSMNLVASTNAIQIVCNSAAVAVTDALSTGVTYNFWMHARKGSGANGYGSIGYSTTGTEPTSGTKFAEKTNGANTDDFHSIQLRMTTDAGANTTSGELIFDKLLISTTGTIGNDPA